MSLALKRPTNGRRLLCTLSANDKSGVNYIVNRLTLLRAENKLLFVDVWGATGMGIIVIVFLWRACVAIAKKGRGEKRDSTPPTAWKDLNTKQKQDRVTDAWNILVAPSVCGDQDEGTRTTSDIRNDIIEDDDTDLLSRDPWANLFVDAIECFLSSNQEFHAIAHKAARPWQWMNSWAHHLQQILFWSGKSDGAEWDVPLNPSWFLISSHDHRKSIPVFLFNGKVTHHPRSSSVDNPEGHKAEDILLCVTNDTDCPTNTRQLNIAFIPIDQPITGLKEKYMFFDRTNTSHSNAGSSTHNNSGDEQLYKRLNDAGLVDASTDVTPSGLSYRKDGSRFEMVDIDDDDVMIPMVSMRSEQKKSPSGKSSSKYQTLDTIVAVSPTELRQREMKSVFPGTDRLFTDPEFVFAQTRFRLTDHPHSRHQQNANGFEQLLLAIMMPICLTEYTDLTVGNVSIGSSIDMDPLGIKTIQEYYIMLFGHMEQFEQMVQDTHNSNSERQSGILASITEEKEGEEEGSSPRKMNRAYSPPPPRREYKCSIEDSRDVLHHINNDRKDVDPELPAKRLIVLDGLSVTLDTANNEETRILHTIQHIKESFQYNSGPSFEKLRIAPNSLFEMSKQCYDNVLPTYQGGLTTLQVSNPIY